MYCQRDVWGVVGRLGAGLMLLVAAAALLCAPASAGDPPPRPWDVAIGKRPYVNETEGHLLLTTPGLAGQRLRVTASLCAGTLGNWSWDVTGGADQELSISLAQLPHLVNNDMLVTVTHASGGDNSSSIRRRFQRAWKSDMRNTVQVDHHTRGLRVDGEPWFGVGWYQYAYTSFVPPDCDPTKVDKSPSGQQKNLECMTWGINNMTEAMGAMASRGINMMMPYSFSPFARHGLSHDLPGGRAGATSIRDKLILSYFDEAAKHGAKLLFVSAAAPFASSFEASESGCTGLRWSLHRRGGQGLHQRDAAEHPRQRGARQGSPGAARLLHM